MAGRYIGECEDPGAGRAHSPLVARSLAPWPPLPCLLEGWEIDKVGDKERRWCAIERTLARIPCSRSLQFGMAIRTLLLG
jgi:hypothetical protein